jgi:hypothetical protein
MASAWVSFSARWSVTPEIDECILPPPRLSASIFSPVAAKVSSGPPRYMKPWPSTITTSSHSAGI